MSDVRGAIQPWLGDTPTIAAAAVVSGVRAGHGKAILCERDLHELVADEATDTAVADKEVVLQR
jgi:hypothetical protein